MKLLKEFVVAPASQPATIPVESAEELLAKKEQFAELSLREDDAFKIALAIYPNDTGRALRIANEWPNDPAVKAFRASFVEAEEDGETAFLPSKADACRLAWNIARDADKTTEDRLKALKLYGEMRGFIEKPAAVSVQNNTNVAMRVLVVKDYGSNDDWEKALRQQQKKLINGEYSAGSN